MRKKLSLQRKGKFPIIYLAVGVLILSGCAGVSTSQVATGDSAVPVIESLKVSPSPEQTVVEIMNSSPARYTAFRLVDPPRIILDIRGTPGSKLPATTRVDEGTVKDIRFEEGKTQAMTTRMVLALARPLDYRAESENNIIRLTLVTEQPSPKAPEPAVTGEAGEEQEASSAPAKPRIFVQPGASGLTQVLGIDFVMLDRGKSRLIVTTDKKGSYDLDQKDSKDLVLKLPGATIPPQLLRVIDSSHFHGAVDRISPAFSAAKKEVAVTLSLREMVPFHVKQTDNEISIDFGLTSVKPPEKKIVPLQLAQAEVQAPAAPAEPAAAPAAVQAQQPVLLPGLLKKQYTGARMTMDFVNADVTNILRLIGEVSNLNIVWDPKVQGNVSMRLKDVPWDQALDLILANNNLGMRTADNVVWITTKGQLAQVEAEEKRRKQEYEDGVRRVEEKAKEKEEKQEPIIAEYIGVDFANADELKSHLEGLLTERGTLSVDERTNTIIIKDTASTIEEAKKLVKQFDTPVKQVMIEARIVDANTSFARDLGIKWDKFQIQNRNFPNGALTNWGGTPSTVSPSEPDDTWTTGANLYSPSFTTNAPDDWSPNVGLVFSKLSSFGLTATILDAKLALAEVEGKSKTIAAPKVIASNGEQAQISRGDQIIIAATENVEATTLDATLSLTVTPNVSYNNYITLNVAVTDDSAPSASRLLKKSINTKLMVKSGETIVIGGIYTEISGEDETGIPGLKRIPFLGWLFKAQRKTVTKTELLIFLTPTVIPSTI
jgi:type IV pilus assembly protein PilQ